MDIKPSLEAQFKVIQMQQEVALMSEDEAKEALMALIELHVNMQHANKVILKDAMNLAGGD